jgi:hypothetical protein
MHSAILTDAVVCWTQLQVYAGRLSLDLTRGFDCFCWWSRRCTLVHCGKLCRQVENILAMQCAGVAAARWQQGTRPQ